METSDFALRSALVALLWVLSGLAAIPAQAATCTWTAATESSWTDPANWSGCASGNGSPSGTPGPADRAVLPSGTGKAIFLAEVLTIAELEMASGSALGIEITQTTTRQLTVSTAVSLAGATLEGALPAPGGPNPASLSLVIPATATLTLAGANVLRRAIVTNSGTATMTGGPAARLDFDLNGSYVNAASGTTRVQGAYVLGYTTSGEIDNRGQWIIEGPGLVTIQRSGASGGRFQSTGAMDIQNATFALQNPAPGFQSLFSGSLWLRGGAFDANTQTVSIGSGRRLRGSGTVIGSLSMVAGSTLDPEAANGDPIGLITINGTASFGGAELVLDLAGPTPTQHDRVAISGSVQWARVSPRVRMIGGHAPGIDSGFPIATHASVVSPTLPVHDRVLSDYPLSLALRVAPTQTRLRVVPTLTLAPVAIVEGNAGTQVLNFAATLSAPTTETVALGYDTQPGTAISFGGGGSVADYVSASGTVSFAPGELSKQIPITINGDTAVEADEAFAVGAGDEFFLAQPTNASFGNNRRFSTAAEGRIQNDDGASGTRYLLIAKATNLPTQSGQTSFVRRYTTSGVFVDGWPTRMQANFGAVATGFCRSPNGNVLSTRFSEGAGPVLMSVAGAVLDNGFGGLIGADESCAFDLTGNVWIGEAVPTSASTAPLRYVAADGRLLDQIEVPVGERGTDWIELDANQCTLYYTSEDGDVRRYDVCTRQPLPHFATGLTPRCYALRQLPNGELMVTCSEQIYRYAADGTLIRDYTKASLGENDAAGLYAVQLDPDGETFWTGGALSGRVVRARIDTGAIVTSFTTGTGGINGLLIQDEFVAATSNLLFKDDFEASAQRARTLSTRAKRGSR